MVKVLKAVQPDALLLQESFRADTPSESIDTAALLADALRMHLAFAPARTKVRAFEGEYVESVSGHAILSKNPLESIERRELVTTPEGGERIALFARTQIRETSLALACVHFAHRRGDGTISTQQFSSVMNYLAQFRQTEDLSLIGGDFNMSADSPDFKNACIPPKFTVQDPFEKQGSETPTHPVPAKEGRPGRHIDFLLTLSSESEPTPQVLDRGIAGIEYDATFATYPSDHALVWADFEV